MIHKITYLIGALCGDTAPGKKMIQKLFYLAERKGLDLDLSYAIHFYGPYSSDLDEMLHMLQANNMLEIDTSGKTHKLKVLNMPENPLSAAEKDILADIKAKFATKTPLELEVLTTTDYVAHHLLDSNNCSQSAIIARVKSIKGNKFSESQIADSIAQLRADGLLPSEVNTQLKVV